LFRPYQPKAASDQAAPIPPIPSGAPGQAGETASLTVEAAETVEPASATVQTRASIRTKDPAPGVSAAPSAPAKTKATPVPAKAKTPPGGSDEREIARLASTKTVIAPPTPGVRQTPGSARKAAPTPTRKQALAARQERLNPVLNKKDQRRRDRDTRAKLQLEQQQKMHDQPVMTMIRDFIDCRWTVAEFILPAILLIVLAPMLLASQPTVLLITTTASFVIYIGMILDLAQIWFRLRRQILTRFPGQSLKGKLSYASSRAMMPRRWRRPAAVVRRGTKFVWPRAS
jgi:hypothetical protein